MRKEEGRRLLLRVGVATTGAILLDRFGLPLIHPAIVAAKEAEPEPPKEISDFENVGLMYHEISYGKLYGDIMGYLRSGYQPVSLETMVKGIRKEIYIPKSLPIFHVTLDDGLKSQMAAIKVVQDVYEQTGVFVPLTFFIPPQFGKKYAVMNEVPDNQEVYVEEIRGHFYMTKQDLLLLISHGHRLENHTANHGNLPSLSVSARNAEIRTGEELIQQLWRISGKTREFKAFAYPNGSFTIDILRQVQSEGYDIVFATDYTTADPSLRHLALRRFRKT